MYESIKKVALTNYSVDENGNHVFTVAPNECDILVLSEHLSDLLVVIHGTNIVYDHVKRVPQILLAILVGEIRIEAPPSVEVIPCSFKFLTSEKREELRNMVRMIIDREHLIAYRDGKLSQLFTGEIAYVTEF